MNTAKKEKQVENIYEESIEKVAQGAKFLVDFEKRALKVGNRWIITSGENPGERLGVDPEPLENVLYKIDELYSQYKHSVPSERSEARRKRYFYALPEDELSDEAMLYGMPRDVAQISLELYILASVLNGSLVWDESLMGKWFWQSSADRDLIILKQWTI